MSPGPDDPSGTLPPDSGSAPTLPVPAPSFGNIPPIPRGQALAAFSAALDDLSRAYLLVEAIGCAACRALDQLENEETNP
jgi:hypothetical protein